MKERIEKFLEDIMLLKGSIANLKKYKSNKIYLNKYNKQIKEINKEFIFLLAAFKKFDFIPEGKLDTFELLINQIIGRHKYDAKLEIIEKIEFFWPKLMVEFEEFNIKSFDIPEKIPLNESRLDLEEAIKDYDNGCFISAIVLCRRSYEGALLEIYKSKEKKDPIEIRTCKHCKNELGKYYKGIANLHKWAIDKKLINSKFQSVGYLVSDLGAGGAHPPLENFPRDKEIAKISITTLIVLLKEIYKN